MYRTYRNLYRIRPSISSFGHGHQKIRLPRGVSITLDVAVLTLILWIPCTLFIGNLLIQFIPISSYLIGLSASGFISYRLGKLDPAGKFMIQFLSDYLKYRFRSKVHDGFERRRRTKNHPQPVYFNLDFTLIEGNRIGSFPAEGHVQFIELKTEASISVDKYGLVTINDKGDLLPPGSYDIKDGGITEKSVPPKIMPIPSSLPRK